MIKYYLAIITTLIGICIPDDVGYKAPEVCDNGIDDDMDGLIDLNDTIDCRCNGISDSLFVPASLIPNYSFEDTLCCPTRVQQLNCAKDWIQASRATSDYYHTCGFGQDRARGRPPLPLPSGDAYVGFLNTWWLDTIVWKEYIGACLDKPMEMNKNYRLQFYLGFSIGGDLFASSSPMTVVLYGTEDCENLPFGGPNYTQCPANLSEWFEIARVTLDGANEWVRGTMSFNLNRDVQAVAIGPTCDDPPGEDYYFLDELVLNEQVSFDQFQFDILGETCDSLLRLWTSQTNGINYQWYRNGIAMMGETQPELFITNRDSGTYILRASDGVDCELSNTFEHYPIHHETRVDTSICQGEVFSFLNRVFRQATRDTFYLNNRFGCDSTIFLDLHLLDTTVSRIDTSVCIDQEVVIEGRRFTGPGDHRIITTNAQGCDSFIYLSITIGDTFHITNDTVLCAGNGFEFQGQYIDSSGVFRFPLMSTGECDSVVTWRVDIIEENFLRLDSFICGNESISLGDTIVSTSGIYLRPFKNRLGCDSLVEWNVAKWEADSTGSDTVLCWGQAIEWYGRTLDRAGLYEIRRPGRQSCDTIVTLTVKEVEPFENVSEGIVDLDCHDTLLSDFRIELQPPARYTIVWDDGSTGMTKQDLSPGVYYYTVQDEYGCGLRDSLVITAPQPISVDVEAKNPDCNQEASGKIEIGNPKGGESPFSIFVNGERSGQRLDDLEAGTYEIEIIDAKNCMYDTVVTLININKGEMHLSDLNRDTFVVGDPIVLLANVINMDTVVITDWRGWEDLCTYCLTDTIFPTPGTYQISLKIIDGNGCEYFDVLQFEVIQKYWVPNAFTPNDDFLNDFFNVFTDRSIETIDELYIFDRWGEIVYKGLQITPGHNVGWDGTFHGQPMLPGVYVYLANFRDKIGQEFQVAGDVTLIR